MLNFTTTEGSDFSSFGRRIWLDAQEFESHEQASQYFVENLYREFLSEEQEPLLALVRVFCLTHVDELPLDVQAKVSRDEQQVMALTGTYGMEEAWLDRRRSENHQAVPIGAIAVPRRIPMFQEVMTQLGIDLQHFYDTKELITASDRPYTGTFHLPDVPTASAIPDQDDFVIPYGIMSLVGFGGFMGTANRLYLVYAFSRVFVSSEAARNFYQMQSFIGAALAKEDQIFAD